MHQQPFYRILSLEIECLTACMSVSPNFLSKTYWNLSWATNFFLESRMAIIQLASLCCIPEIHKEVMSCLTFLFKSYFFLPARWKEIKHSGIRQGGWAYNSNNRMHFLHTLNRGCPGPPSLNNFHLSHILHFLSPKNCIAPLTIVSQGFEECFNFHKVFTLFKQGDCVVLAPEIQTNFQSYIYGWNRPFYLRLKCCCL